MNDKSDGDKWSDYYDTGGDDIFKKVEGFEKLIKREEANTACIFRRPVMSATGARVKVLDPESGKVREMIMMGSNSYLSLNASEEVIEASMAAARKYGYGTGSVSLYSGTTDLHLELERRIAAFYGCEDAILYPTGYAANVGTISALLRPGNAAVNDMFNHASIFDGCLLSGATLQRFAHGRTRQLERILKRNLEKNIGTLVITDGVFSMEGDVAQLDEICTLAKKFNARVMIDEAHALGVIGPTGRGTADLYKLNGQVDVTVGTLSKLPGGIGGYAAGSKAMVDYLRYYARPFFFSTSIPAPVVAGLIEVFKILEEDSGPREALWRNINYAVVKLKEIGYDVGKSASAIIPIMVGEEATLKQFAVDLHRRGIYMSYVAYPAVPAKRCRMRMSLLAQHSREDIDFVLGVLEELGNKYGILPQNSSGDRKKGNRK